MLLAVYTAAGAAVLVLLALLLLGIALLAWLAYWWPRGFRAAPTRSRGDRIVRRTAAALLLALAVTIVPMRRAGDWTHETTAAPASAYCAAKLDRYLYGYIPSYDFILNTGREHPERSGTVITLPGCGPYGSWRSRWVVDGVLMSGQLGVVFLVMLPFLRARREEGRPN